MRGTALPQDSCCSRRTGRQRRSFALRGYRRRRGPVPPFEWSACGSGVAGGRRFVLESAEEAARPVDEACRASGRRHHRHGQRAEASSEREGVGIVDKAASSGADAIMIEPGPSRSWRRLFARGVRGQLLRLSAIPVIIGPTPPGQWPCREQLPRPTASATPLDQHRSNPAESSPFPRGYSSSARR